MTLISNNLYFFIRFNICRCVVAPALAVPTETFSVTPLVAWSMDFITTDILVPLPLFTTIYDFPHANRSSFDMNLTIYLSTWLEGRLFDGENGQIARNDGLFQSLCYLGGLDGGSRNKSECSTIATTRSDATLFCAGLPIVNIEEKDSNMNEAVNDLLKKFYWIPNFHMLPAVFGVAITREKFQIVSLHRDKSFVILANFSLDTAFNRWQCVLAMVNIARAIKFFTANHLYVASTLRFNIWHRRLYKRLRMRMSYVEVEYYDLEHYRRMKLFYEATKSVRYLEHLHTLLGVDDMKNRLKLVPLGIEVKPRSVTELINAIKHVTTCIDELHNKSYCHCDIRWSNIVVSDENWYVIDCEHACHCNDHVNLRIKSSIIKPRYVMDNSQPWNKKFDWFQIGRLLQDVMDITSQHSKLTEIMDTILSRDFSVTSVKRMINNLN